jgi:hypothetical protein
MLAALVANGKREREARRTARALELWNRALAIDPTNREVLTELKRLESRQQIKRGSLIALGVALLGGGAILVLRHASETTGGPPTVAVLPPAPKPASKQAGPAANPGAKAGAKTVASANPPAEGPNPGEARPASKRTVSFRPQTAPRPNRPAAEKRTIKMVISNVVASVSVEGGPAKPVEPGSNTVDLEWDRSHSLVFRNDDCCFEERREVGPDNEPENNTLIMTMRGKPGRLLVTTEPPAKGKVFVTETERGEDETGSPVRLSGLVGEEILIPFTGDHDMTKKLLLTIAVEGKPPQNTEVTIRANTKHPVPVKLD